MLSETKFEESNKTRLAPVAQTSGKPNQYPSHRPGDGAKRVEAGKGPDPAGRDRPGRLHSFSMNFHNF